MIKVFEPAALHTQCAALHGSQHITRLLTTHAKLSPLCINQRPIVMISMAQKLSQPLLNENSQDHD